jgi:hypothetical protein
MNIFFKGKEYDNKTFEEVGKQFGFDNPIISFDGSEFTMQDNGYKYTWNKYTWNKETESWERCNDIKTTGLTL